MSLRATGIGMAVLVLLQDQKPVPMRDVSLAGVIDPAQRSLAAKVVAAIGTPFGKIPITGHLKIRIDCQGAFAGTISYHPVVRFLARVKRVDLVTELDGSIAQDADSGCSPLAADTVRGAAVVEKTQLSGGLRMAGDSVRFVGPAWTVGDSTYHSLVRVTRATRTLDLRVNLYERGSARRGSANRGRRA
jgi:hypothetical protein